jgi:hypothetical protein
VFDELVSDMSDPQAEGEALCGIVVFGYRDIPECIRRFFGALFSEHLCDRRMIVQIISMKSREKRLY